jgi:pimeloyl-ACP methyl ester carboxylesterase
VWIGHSTGCQIVKELSALAPELVAGSVYLSPIWSGSRRSMVSLAVALFADVMREPPALVPEVAANYWRVGLIRWFGTLLFELRSSGPVPPPLEASIVVIGDRDPLADRSYLESLGDLRIVPGAAHAVNFSEPEAIAESIADDLRRWLAFDYTAGDGLEHSPSP